MVRYSYADFEEQYKEIQKAACGRQACSVLILVALEVSLSLSVCLSDCMCVDDVGLSSVGGCDGNNQDAHTNVT